MCFEEQVIMHKNEMHTLNVTLDLVCKASFIDCNHYLAIDLIQIKYTMCLINDCIIKNKSRKLTLKRKESKKMNLT